MFKGECEHCGKKVVGYTTIHVEHLLDLHKTSKECKRIRSEKEKGGQSKK